MRNADRVTAVLLLAFSAAFAAAALRLYKWWGDDGPGPAFLPFWLGLLMAALALALLARNLRRKDRGEPWLPRGEGLQHTLVVLAASVAFVALLQVTGMILGTALFLAGLLRYLGRHRWWVCAAVAAGAAGFNWLVFAHWLRVPLPEGMLWIF